MVLDIGVQKEIWERYTQKNEKLVAISREMGLTYDQCRETIRRFKSGIRSPNSNQIKMAERNQEIVEAKMDANRIREEALEELNAISKELPPEEAMTKVMAIKTKLQIANSLDKYEGRGTPHTQINIVQLRLDETRSKLDELIRWIVQHCSHEQVAQLKEYLLSKNIEPKVEEEKAIDAEYTVVNQS